MKKVQTNSMFNSDLTPMFDGCVMMNEASMKDKAVMAALQALYEDDFREVIISNYPSSMPGDVNADEIVNILDIIQLVNMILQGEYADNADLNSDGIVNILDIIQIANIILSNE